jgi:hypothetical protein
VSQLDRNELAVLAWLSDEVGGGCGESHGW